MEEPRLQDLFPPLQVALSEIFLMKKLSHLTLPASSHYIRGVGIKYLEHVSVSDGQLSARGYRYLGLEWEIAEMKLNAEYLFLDS